MELEEAVRQHLAGELPGALTHAQVEASRKQPISRFAQHEHLATLKGLIDQDETLTLRASIGGDYVIKPDVTVDLDLDQAGAQILHAAVRQASNGSFGRRPQSRRPENP